MPAGEILGLLRQAATAAAGCRALARCGDMDVDSNLLEALVEALHALGPVDDAVARHGCTALVSLCRSSADKQAQVVACGAFAAAAARARTRSICRRLAQRWRRSMHNTPPLAMQCPSWAPAPPRGVPGGSGQLLIPKQRDRPAHAQPLPPMFELAASKVANSIAFGFPGGPVYG